MTDLIQDAQPFLQVLQWAVAIIAAVFMLYMRSVFVSKKDHDSAFEKAAVEQDAVIARVQTLETAQKLIDDRLKSGPTAKDVHELQIGMTQLSGKLDVANERMSGVEDLQEMIKRQVQVMDEWMRDHK